MSSDKRREANRRNGKRGAGPISPEGKARASSNAMTHKLFAARLLPGEHDVYSQLLVGYGDYFRPVGVPEQSLVRKIAFDELRLIRFEAAEYAYLQGAGDSRTEGPVSLPEPCEQELFKVKAYVENKLASATSPESQLTEDSHAKSQEDLDRQKLDLLDWHVRALEGIAPAGQGGPLNHLCQSKIMIEGSLQRKMKLLVALQERRTIIDATVSDDISKPKGNVKKPKRNVARGDDKPKPAQS